MVRTPSYDTNGMKKGAWSAEEDQFLRAYITTYGHGNWRELPKFAGLKRCGKSCRLRWMNYLRPNLKHGNYTKEEEDLIIQLHQKHGNKWAILASKLPGRTDNEIKNHWHTHLKKRVTPPHKPIPTPFTNKNDAKPFVSDQTEKRLTNSDFQEIQILESCPFLSQQVTPTSTCTPISRELSTSTLSSFEIINSSELFAELSSIMTDDHLQSATSSAFNGLDSATLTRMDGDVWGGGEMQVQDEDFWSEINQTLSSPGVNYYDDDLLDFFCNNHLAADHGSEYLP
ncbi:hypothetical protein V2J09_003997 [Rumex salicifolius]